MLAHGGLAENGLATASADSAVSGAGNAAGIGAAAATGTGIVAAIGSTSGLGAATGADVSTAASAGQSAGVGAASGVGTNVKPGVGNAAGVGAAVGDITDQVVIASGHGVATGVGTSISAAVGTASGAGAINAVGASTAASTGLSAGVGAGLAVSTSQGSAAGVGAATGVGRSIFTAVGSSAGVGAALASGIGIGTIQAVGSAAGVGAGAAIGRATGVSAEVRARNNIILITMDGIVDDDVMQANFATEGLTTRHDDQNEATWFDGRVVDPGNFEEHLFQPGATSGQSIATGGDVQLASADIPGAPGETLDYLLDWAIDGRPILIRSIANRRSPLSTANTLFLGTMEQLISDNAYEVISVKLKSKLKELEQPLLQTTFAGTTTSGASLTVEGDVQLAGVKKQKVYGKAFTVAPQIANAFQFVYLWSDGPCDAILMSDGGQVLINDGDVPSIAALFSWVPSPDGGSAGHYITCLAHGLSRAFAAAIFQFTADVTESTSSAAQIAQHMIRDFYGLASVPVELILTSPDLWGVRGTATIVSNQLDDEGLLTAFKIVEGGSDDFHAADYPIVKAQKAISYTLRAKVKPSGSRWAFVGLRSSNGSCGVGVNLTSGAIEFTNVSGGYIVLASSTLADDFGYFSIELSVTTNADADLMVEIYSLDSAGEFIYNGDGVSGVFYDDVSLFQINQTEDATFTVLHAKNSGACGWLVTGDETVVDAATSVLASVQGWLTASNVGLFRVGRMEAPEELSPDQSPVEDIDDFTILGNTVQRIATGDDGRGIPNWKFTGRYQKNWTVLTGNQVDGAVSELDLTRAAFLANEWRLTDPAQDLAVKGLHLSSTEVTFETAFVNKADAQAEAVRRLAMYSVRRDAYRVQVPLDYGIRLQLGTTVRMSLTDPPRFGLATGKNGVVIGRLHNYKDKLYELDVWGIRP